ncbi:sensor histidine kinase [Microlunatus sp. GCM10028923]|uniref:sensor histidine kinase n=1 Tax=Microlunatus sp. GCM10028923 TaxID=3273400 RepID=UPI003608A57A
MDRQGVRGVVAVAFAALAAVGFVGAACLAVTQPVNGAEPWLGVVWLLAGPLPFFLVGVAGRWRGPIRCTLAAPLLWVGGTGAIAAVLGYLAGAADPAGPLRQAKIGLMITYQLACMIMIVLLTRALALLPDGRYRYPYERIILRGLWLLPLLGVISFVTAPAGRLDQLALPGDGRPVPGPVPVPTWLPEPLASAYQDYWFVAVIGVALFLIRAVRMSPAERRMFRVIVIVMSVLTIELVALVVGYLWFADETLNSLLPNGILGLLPFVGVLATVVVAGVRNGVLGVGPAARRTLVYAGLWILIAGVYLGLATGLGLAATARLPVAIAIVITVAATIALEPVRRWVNQIAERQVFGHRLSGYEVLIRLGSTLEHAGRPHELAELLATGLRDGLGLAWAEVRLEDSVATAGTRIGPAVLEQPLRHDGVELGMIRCGTRLDGPYGPRDHELIDTLARQTVLALQNRRQTVELEASRARIVQAQDAERRRIERDLHDGVQQELVALVAKLGLTRSTLRRDADRAGRLIEELQGEVVRIVDDLRELAHGIHPSVLSDEGLVAAVESSARRMPIPVTVSTSTGLRNARFPVEVEESAFYFVAESLTNVLKHARATNAAIDLVATDGSLQLEVRDNGSGLPPMVCSGSGLIALRDRIEAVGGTVRVGNAPAGGATVHARLPTAAEVAAP